MAIIMSMGWDYVSELRPPMAMACCSPPFRCIEHGDSWWNNIYRGKLLIRPPELSDTPTSSQLVVKQEELAKEMMNLAYEMFNISNGSLKFRKILRHGADGFTSPPREGVLRNFIALTRVWSREPWVQWQARYPLDHRGRLVKTNWNSGPPAETLREYNNIVSSVLFYWVLACLPSHAVFAFPKHLLDVVHWKGTFIQKSRTIMASCIFRQNTSATERKLYTSRW
jgi:hypothetical protein